MSTDLSSTDSSQRILDWISAVAAGDAAREEVTAAMRDEGLDALDLLVEVLAAATRKGSRIAALARPVDPQRQPPSEPRRRPPDSPHPVPGRPFLLRGTLYDPADVHRFEDRDLHFLAAPGRDDLLAFDDRSVMESWWQSSLIAANSSYHPNKVLAAEGDGTIDTSTVGTTNFGPGTGTPEGKVVVGHPGGSSGPEGFSMIPGGGPPKPHTNFYEDVNFDGSRLELAPNRGYPDLTEVPWTFLGTGDWNDTISSIQLVATQVAVLWEHVDWQGSTFTTTESVSQLEGWNDVASGCETW